MLSWKRRGSLCFAVPGIRSGKKCCKPLPALSSLNGFCRINLLFLLNGGYSEWEEVSSQGTGLSVESPWERQLALHWVTSSRGPLNILLKGSECRLYPVHQSTGQRESRQTALQVTSYHVALARSCPSCPWGLRSHQGENADSGAFWRAESMSMALPSQQTFQSKKGESSWQWNRAEPGPPGHRTGAAQGAREAAVAALGELEKFKPAAQGILGARRC